MDVTVSDAAASSDAADSPKTDPHSKTKRPDKQLYVPRQKREEPSESDSPATGKNQSADENSGRNEHQKQGGRYNKPNSRGGGNGGGKSRQYDDSGYSRGGGGGGYRRTPRDNNNNNNNSNNNDYQQHSTSAPRVNRKTEGDNEGGEFHTTDRPKQQKQRPATSGGSSQQQQQGGSSSRTFHNSSGTGSGSGGSSSRRPPQNSEGKTGKPRQQRSTWNDDNYYDDNYYEGGYYHSGGYYGSNSSNRYNNSNTNSTNNNNNSNDNQHQRRGAQRSNHQQQRGQPRGSTDLSLAEQTKAAEAIVSQLPDLLAPMPPKPHASGSSTQQKFNSRRDDNNSNSSQQYQSSSDKNQQYQAGGKNRSGGGGAYRGGDDGNDYHHRSGQNDNNDQQGGGGVTGNDEDAGRGHRGGLLFISQTNRQQNDEYHQQISPFSRNATSQSDDQQQQQLSSFHSQALLTEIEQAEQGVILNFQTSGLNLAYIEMLLVRLRQLYSNSIMGDAEFALENNRDQAMWNGVFYKLYSILRYNLIELRQTRFAPSVAALIDETVHFYEDICERLADKYHVNIENSVATAKKLGEKRSTKSARLLLQRLYISLGDLFRYRCSCCGGQPTTIYADTAQRHYETAQRLAPKNSHPFNQLAVLALMAKRRFDAVYYFCRVLAAQNPILSVVENLMAIFNDACRRSEADQAFDEESERNRRQSLPVDSRRSEVWVSGDGRRTIMSGTPFTELDESRYGAIVQRLPLSQLAQRLVDSILNVHGRIFSKVGLDSLPDAVSRCLWELEASLTVDLPMLTPVRLCQLTLLNFFSVWRCSVDKSANKSLAEIFAVEFVLDCAALIIRHARILFVEQKFDALRRLMPCVKLYADWLMYNRNAWYPPPCAIDPTTCPDDLDLFAQIAGFANITALCDVSVASEAGSSNAPAGGDLAALVPVRLDEDDLVAGFAPFAKSRLVAYEMKPGTEPTPASFAARLQRFRTLCDYLCGIDPPVLEYNLEQYTFTSLISTVCRSEQKKQQPQQATQVAATAANVPTGTLPPPLFDFSPKQQQQQQQLAVESELDAMRRRRRDLVAEAERKRADEEFRRELMMREEQQGVAAGSVVMEVRPLVLVIDTNSIVDYMPAIQRIVESSKFTIVLPLVVVSELEALSSGPRSGRFGGPMPPPPPASGEDDRNEEHVTQAARNALSFFEMQFNRRNNRIKAMTSEGNMVDSIAFRDQIRSVPISNDDAILGCALHYCKMNESLDRQAAMTAAQGGSGSVIVREVVLVTCDRNLRIKAHLNRVPTCPMRTLLNWARIPTSGSSNINVQ